MNEQAPTRAAVGNPWWESALFRALLERDVDRLTWLVTLAEAETTKGAPL